MKIHEAIEKARLAAKGPTKLNKRRSLNESIPPATVKIDIAKLIPMCREEIGLAEDMSDEEIKEVLEGFVEEISTPEGILLLFDNLDYFNF